MTVVLDSSAVLAVILDEPGADNVEAFLPQSVIATVNLCEVYTRLLDASISKTDAAMLVEALGVETIAFTDEMALATASLRTATRHLGLSMGDRACIALARTLGVPALTADRQWTKADLGVEIRLIR
jgi:ribonuclease VapC